jgi:siroheme synthase (precorrin-2 oxidase/ferrochelatase)
MYTDLAFTAANTNLIQWVTSLEERLQQLIYEKRDSWFATENIELDDIQNAYTL